jgi:hypothetical protein
VRAEISPFLHSFGQRIGLKGWVSWEQEGSGPACALLIQREMPSVCSSGMSYVTIGQCNRFGIAGRGNRLLINALIMFEIDLEIVKNIEA